MDAEVEVNWFVTFAFYLEFFSVELNAVNRLFFLPSAFDINLKLDAADFRLSISGLPVNSDLYRLSKSKLVLVESYSVMTGSRLHEPAFDLLCVHFEYG